MIKFLCMLALLSLSSMSYGRTVLLTSSNSVVLRTPFYDEFTTPLMQEILVKDSKLPKDQPLYLVLDTPGGSVDAGVRLINLIKSLAPRKVHTITLFAASMGFLTVQSLNDRLMLPNSVMMSHRPTTQIGGQYPGELDSRYKFDVNYLSLILKGISARLGLTVDDLTSMHYNEAWYTTERALDDGVADEVITAKCGPDLVGMIGQPLQSMFGTFTVVWSKCPLINAPLAIVYPESTAQPSVEETERRRAIHMMFYNKEAYYYEYLRTGRDIKLRRQ